MVLFLVVLRWLVLVSALSSGLVSLPGLRVHFWYGLVLCCALDSDEAPGSDGEDGQAVERVHRSPEAGTMSLQSLFHDLDDLDDAGQTDP